MVNYTREQMLKRAKKILDHTEQMTQGYVGSCDQCKHAKPGFLKSSYTCTNPIVTASSFSVDQDRRDIMLQADYQRRSLMRDASGPVLCGPNGALFEPKPTIIDGIKEWFS